MDVDLVVTLVGLALLDAVNTSTLFVVMVILLTARTPSRAAAAAAVAATTSFLALAIALYAGATAAAAVVGDLARWMRRITFALLALWLFHLGFKRLRDRPRRGFVLPGWFTPLTAVPIGVVATLADLPNAFPLLLAVERLTSAGLAWTTAVPVLVVYAAVYAAPIAVLVGLGAWRGERVRGTLRRVTDRFLTGTARRSVPLAVTFAAGGAAAGTVAALG